MKHRPKWRPVVVIGVVLCLALFASACGSSSSASTSSASNSGNENGESSNVAAEGRPSWCGEKEITLADADGFGDNNWRKIARKEAENEAAKCPSVKEFKYTDGQGNTQKSISDIEGLAAQGVNAVITLPDAGKVMLPALTNAYHAGVTVVPYNVDPGGEDGVNYDAYLATDYQSFGQYAGEWMVQALHNHGKVLTLGGMAGNSASTEVFAGFDKAVEGSGLELLGEQPFTATDWDPAKVQQVVTAALAKYPEIDGILTDYGPGLASALPVFAQAGREVPAIATQDSNELSCDQKELGFPLFTVSSLTWHVRTAVQIAVANASEGQVPPAKPQKDPPFEDSITGKPHPVECNKQLPTEAILSSQLTPAEQKEALE
jgi:ribose transport system substrate-binding protein